MNLNIGWSLNTAVYELRNCKGIFGEGERKKEREREIVRWEREENERKTGEASR